mmetsp:Transcript_3148/g.7354  ORF Transcript_3148/g.7354 Transcript_3148/m.7354 type:complete len:232 (+) Transcript_3148:208-903(+)
MRVKTARKQMTQTPKRMKRMKRKTKPNKAMKRMPRKTKKPNKAMKRVTRKTKKQNKAMAGEKTVVKAQKMAKRKTNKNPMPIQENRKEMTTKGATARAHSHKYAIAERGQARSYRFAKMKWRASWFLGRRRKPENLAGARLLEAAQMARPRATLMQAAQLPRAGLLQTSQETTMRRPASEKESRSEKTKRSNFRLTVRHPKAARPKPQTQKQNLRTGTRKRTTQWQTQTKM